MPQAEVGVIGGTGLYDIIIKHSGYQRILLGG